MDINKQFRPMDINKRFRPMDINKKTHTYDRVSVGQRPVQTSINNFVLHQ